MIGVCTSSTFPSANVKVHAIEASKHFELCSLSGKLPRVCNSRITFFVIFSERYWPIVRIKHVAASKAWHETGNGETILNKIPRVDGGLTSQTVALPAPNFRHETK